ncbi:MAG: DUF1330 domain-containing protein [Saprospiraceae bacterium]|nr:DUF1330 domain-containing protein [Saprospiraceae bacterium]
MQTFIDPSEDAQMQFLSTYQQKGKIVMMNLIKFKAFADYTNIEIEDPQINASGKGAYHHYLQATGRILKSTKVGQLLFYGKSSTFLIGPATEQWDAVLMVEYRSAQHFLQFANSEAFAKVKGHRTAAIEDSRLLPIAQAKKLW